MHQKHEPARSLYAFKTKADSTSSTSDQDLKASALKSSRFCRFILKSAAGFCRNELRSSETRVMGLSYLQTDGGIQAGSESGRFERSCSDSIQMWEEGSDWQRPTQHSKQEHARSCLYKVKCLTSLHSNMMDVSHTSEIWQRWGLILWKSPFRKVTTRLDQLVSSFKNHLMICC